MWNQYLFFVCCYAAIISLTDSAPPNNLSKICKPDDSQCIKETAMDYLKHFAAGLPEYNVPVLDPLSIKYINASEGSLVFELNDVTVVGLKNCEVKKIERDIAKSKMHIKILCSGTLDGQYILKGSLLFVPIEGNGAVHVDLKSAIVNMELDMVDKDGDDGKKHWNIKSWKHTFELKDKSNVVFENLFNGNEVLGRAARDLIKDNGNEVIMEIGPKVIKALAAKIVKYINNFFKAVPAEDLSLE